MTTSLLPRYLFPLTLFLIDQLSLPFTYFEPVFNTVYCMSTHYVKLSCAFVARSPLKAVNTLFFYSNKK